MVVSNDSKLNILIPNDNKVLKEALKEVDLKQLLSSNKNLSIKDILSNILDQIKNSSKSNQTILDMLKNSTVFKDLGSFANNLSNLLKILPQSSDTKSLKAMLQNFLFDIKNLDENKLKDKILNSGIFLESKLTKETKGQSLSNNIQNDLRVILFKLQEETSSKEITKHIDKLLTQIDYYQLLSVSDSSNYVYLPFMWDFLNNGSINMKKLDEDKFYCRIDLELKELGKLDLHLFLYENKNLDISMFIEKSDVKELIMKNITILKQALHKINLTPINLRINNLENEENIQESQKNVYTKSENLDFALNIKV